MCGDRHDPDGHPLTQPVVQDAALARRRPEWGYGNPAGAFRADLWRRRPFRADLPGCEDKEWAWHCLQQGYSCVLDPALAVEHDHTHDSLRSIYGRARRQAEGYAAFLDDRPGRHTAGPGARLVARRPLVRLAGPRAPQPPPGRYAGRRQGAASSSSSGAPRA